MESNELDHCQITYNLPTPRTYRSQSIELIGNDFCLSGEGSIEFSSTQHQNTSIVLSGKFTDNNLEASEIHLNANGYKYPLPKDNYQINQQSQDPTIVNLQSKSGNGVTINLNDMTILSVQSYPKFQIDPINGKLINYSNKFIQSEVKDALYIEYQINENESYWVEYDNQSKTIFTGPHIKQFRLVGTYKFNPNAYCDELADDFHEGYREPAIRSVTSASFTNVYNIVLNGKELTFNGNHYQYPNITKSFTYNFTNGQSLPN